MEPVDIEVVYAELEKMFVALEPSPEKGLAYVAERLTLCRAMQDRVAELRLKVARALTVVMEQLMVAKQIQLLTPTDAGKARVSELDVLKARHVMLDKMVQAQSQLLSRTGQDIRLLADLTKEQIKRKEIIPPAELSRDVPVEELVGTRISVVEDFPLPQPVVEPLMPKPVMVVTQAPPAMDRQTPVPIEALPPLIDFSQLTMPVAASPVRIADVQPGFTVTAITNTTVVPPSDRLMLPDDSVVSFEDLFEENHGPIAAGVF